MTTTEPAKSPGAHYDRRLQHVLASAAAVIAREGYAGASIRKVAKEAEMSLAGLYYYFRSKEELLFLIQSWTFESLLVALRGRLSDAPEPEEALKRFIGNHLEFFVHHMDALKVCSLELESLTGDFYERIEKLRREYFRRALSIVTSLTEARVSPQPDPRLATLSLFGMLNWIYTWYPDQRDLSGRRLQDEMLRLFLDGVRGA